MLLGLQINSLCSLNIITSVRQHLKKSFKMAGALQYGGNKWECQEFKDFKGTFTQTIKRKSLISHLSSIRYLPRETVGRFLLTTGWRLMEYSFLKGENTLATFHLFPGIVSLVSEKIDFFFFNSLSELIITRSWKGKVWKENSYCKVKQTENTPITVVRENANTE